MRQEKQDKSSIPYAWYWHGKPLRTGLAQGEKIRPVCTGSHILQTSDHGTADRACCSSNIPDKQSYPCGHGHGNNAENHHWIPEPPQQNPNSYSSGVQQPRPCGSEGQQGEIPSCSAPTFTCQGCARDTSRSEPCSLDRYCTCTAESTCLPGYPYGQSYPASRCRFCPHPKPDISGSDSPRPRSHYPSAPVKCQQSFTRFESCDRFDCCEDTFFSKCEYSTEESMMTDHDYDADFETRSYHRRRPWVNRQVHRKF